MTGVSFDRAADYYDRTRGLPGDAATRLADMLSAELSGRGLCLEVGVGTGRIALPLHEQGVRLVGSDLAAAMLGRLVDNAGGRQPFPVLQADVLRLPFADASFDAVLASHVLHLIADWQVGVDEIVRVLRPGGSFLVDFGGGVRGPWADQLERIFIEHGIRRFRPGLSVEPPLTEHLRGRATRRALPTIELGVERSLGKDLADLQGQIVSWTWPYPVEQIRAACDGVRAWAVEAGVALDQPATMRYALQWWAYDV